MKSRLGRVRARKIRPNHGTVFPNLSFLPNGTLRIWHPRGPEKMEIWAWTFVDKAAPPKVKKAQRIDITQTLTLYPFRNHNIWFVSPSTPGVIDQSIQTPPPKSSPSIGELPE